MKATTLGAASVALGAGGCSRLSKVSDRAGSMHPDRNRVLGAYIGAAIGDAIGGPIECQHAARIKKVYGEVTGLLPYKKPPGLIRLGPGYALHPDPGSVTDDTFIRADITRFYIATEPPRTPAMLATWLLENADFRMWWKPAVEALRRIERGEVSAEEGGLTHRQGGGGAWWTPIGILHAGNPRGAAAEAKSLCRPWKAPLERDILAAVQAGLAEGMRDGATVGSMVDAMLDVCGPLARKLMARGAEIGRRAKNGDDLVEQLYEHCLVNKCSTEADGPMPPALEPVPYHKGFYTSTLFAEQQPLAVAAFVFGRGDPKRSILRAAMNGRDADSVATNVGGWVGALQGESGLPADWVTTVCEVNKRDLDIRGLAEQLLRVRI